MRSFRGTGAAMGSTRGHRREARRLVRGSSEVVDGPTQQADTLPTHTRFTDQGILMPARRKLFRHTSTLLLPAVVVAGVLLAPVAVHAATTATAATTVFHDDFTGSSLDLGKWLYTNGTAYPGGPDRFGTGEEEINRPENTTVANGELVITPTREGAQWYSSRIESRADFVPAPGQSMTVSSELALPDVTGPAAQGYWPAFWMLSSHLRTDRWSWPANGEFDIAESVNGLPFSNSVLHCDVWGGACQDPEGINTGGLPCAATSCWGNFHTYGFQWDRTRTPEVMTWSIDGAATLSLRSDDPRLAGAVWNNIAAYGQNIILNVAISGAYPQKKGGDATPATEPGHPMRVRYVDVTMSGATTPPPTPTPTPSVTPTSSVTPSPTPSVTPTPTPSVTPTVVCPPVPTTPPPTAPTTSSGPSNLTVTALERDHITLKWDGDPTATYELLRAGIPVQRVTGTTATDAGLLPNTVYIEAVRLAGTDLRTPDISLKTNP